MVTPAIDWDRPGARPDGGNLVTWLRIRCRNSNAPSHDGDRRVSMPV